jgi:hypothetical protein
MGSGYSPHLLNIGVDVNYWFRPNRAAERAEFREHLSVSREPKHFSELRIGVTVLLFC